MRGPPLTRARPDGRWAYTLYDGAADAFVHALDTRARRHAASTSTRSRERTSRAAPPPRRAAGTLTISDGRRPVVVIDTRTFTTTAATRGSA